MTRPSPRILLALAIVMMVVVLVVVVVSLRRRASQGLEGPAPVSSSGEETTLSSPEDSSSSQGVAGGGTTTTLLEYVAPPKKQAAPRPQANPAASGTSDILPVTTDPVATSPPPLRLNIDSDADGVSDQDETELYRTDPKKPDTDGDSYPDDEEIEKGYNPLGPGTCAQPTCLPSV